MKQNFLVQMRRYEIIGGIIWFVIYSLFMGLLLQLLLRFLNISYDVAVLNAIYFFLNFGITIIIFRRFLAYSLPVAADHPLRFLKGMLLGFCTYWVLSVCLSALVELFSVSTWVPNDDNVEQIAGVSYNIMWVGAVLLAPMTEETLVRGLVFGNIRKKNRTLAYIITALVFALMHVLSYVTKMSIVDFGYNLLVYGLPSVALCVCYEYSGCIWAPILLHMAINAMGMSVM